MRLMVVLLVCAGALGLGAAAGSARPTGIVPVRLVGAYDASFPTPKPTVQGHWVIAIGRHGSFVVTTPLATLFTAGPVSVDGSTITFPPSQGWNCSGPGVYSWRRAGRTLTLSRVDDACAARAFRLANRPWKRFTSYAPVIIIQG